MENKVKNYDTIKKCFFCGAKHSPTWRRGYSKVRLCNKCSMRAKKYPSFVLKEDPEDPLTIRTKIFLYYGFLAFQKEEKKSLGSKNINHLFIQFFIKINIFNILRAVFSENGFSLLSFCS